MVKRWVFGAVVLLTAASASAQQPTRLDSETIRARQRIALIEGMLERAVQNGVDNFSRQIQALAPNADGMAMLMGAPQVRGFPLVPGGVFFDVLMPSLQLSMTWPLRYSQSSDPAALSKLSDLRSELERLSDPQARLELTQRVREIEMQLAGPPQPTRRRGPTNVANVQAPGVGAPPAISPADMALLDDPAEAWRREVRITLMDAMIENIGLNIGPDDYIVIAARGALSSDRLVTDAGDTRTIELKIKGSDLDAYRSKTITLEEARRRVVVREY